MNILKYPYYTNIIFQVFALKTLCPNLQMATRQTELSFSIETYMYKYHTNDCQCTDACQKLKKMTKTELCVPHNIIKYDHFAYDDGKYACVTYNGQVQIIEMCTRQVMYKWHSEFHNMPCSPYSVTFNPNRVLSIAFDFANQRIMMATYVSNIVYDLEGNMIHNITYGNTRPYLNGLECTYALTSDSTTLLGVSCSTSPCVNIYNLLTGKLRNVIKLSHCVYLIACSPNSQLVAFCGRREYDEIDSMCTIMNMETGATIKFKCDDHANTIAFSQDGSTIAIACGIKDYVIQIRDSSTGKHITNLIGHGDRSINNRIVFINDIVISMCNNRYDCWKIDYSNAQTMSSPSDNSTETYITNSDNQPIATEIDDSESSIESHDAESL